MQETLYTNSRNYFEDILAAIDNARFRIDLEVYIFETGTIGQRILASLSNAARRGVIVRVMVDGAGINLDFTRTAEAFIAAGVQVRIYRPLPWRLEQWKYSLISVKGFLKFWRLLSDINHRNHRKMLIIDQRAIWLGSMNISQSHLELESGGLGWRDTAVYVGDADIRIAVSAFDLVWNRSQGKPRRRLIRAQRHSPFMFNFSHTLRRWHHRRLLKLMENAQQRIWITNAYFAPEARLLSALEKAAKRGVDVRILLPKTSDIFFMSWVSAFFYEQLVAANVKIYEYLPSMLHAKTLIIDDWASVGSSNLNRRSLRHDLEIDYQLQRPENIERLAASFEQDLQDSSPLEPDQVRFEKRWQRWLGGLSILLIGHWL